MDAFLGSFRSVVSESAERLERQRKFWIDLMQRLVLLFAAQIVPQIITLCSASNLDSQDL